MITNKTLKLSLIFDTYEKGADVSKLTDTIRNTGGTMELLTGIFTAFGLSASAGLNALSVFVRTKPWHDWANAKAAADSSLGHSLMATRSYSPIVT